MGRPIWNMAQIRTRTTAAANNNNHRNDDDVMAAILWAGTRDRLNEQKCTLSVYMSSCSGRSREIKNVFFFGRNSFKHGINIYVALGSEGQHKPYTQQPRERERVRVPLPLHKVKLMRDRQKRANLNITIYIT